MDKKEEDKYYMPFQGLEKGIVIQDKRIFNETPLKPGKCCHLLTKLLYLLVQGDKFTTAEATDLFFSVTKLFQSNNPMLRRMLYLVLKELSPIAEDVIIVISSLTKDMNSDVELYRANSIRVLCHLLDNLALLGQGERYLKQAIVDKSPYIASAALVSGIHVVKENRPGNVDIVKRWHTEILTATKSQDVMVQYHALALLYKLRQHDRLAIIKLISSLTSSGLRSPYANCLLIRYMANLIPLVSEDQQKIFHDCLMSFLRNKSDMVIYEAARTICTLDTAPEKLINGAISVLSLFLSTANSTLRFSAVRTLNRVAAKYPNFVSQCNQDLESLISDSNRSIATLAITTLLKTGNADNVDRLIQQISHFVSEISDEFKVVVVQSIRLLCQKFPHKHRAMLNFLSDVLREEGGFEYKKTIVDTILNLADDIPECADAALTALCEFIEDCEFTALSIRVLNVLGEKGPTAEDPSKFIRYIYNRVILEKAPIRAASVTALGKFAQKLKPLRESILVLLRRCQFDHDDEVRDRATFYLQLLASDELAACAGEVIHCPVPLMNLELALKQYTKGTCDTPFDLRSVPTIPLVAATPASTASSGGTAASERAAAQKADAASAIYTKMLAEVPEFATYGPLFKSTPTIPLTETETEYLVTCVKHVFASHLVFQFNITNTLNDQVLEHVSVKMEAVDELGADLTVEAEVEADSLTYDTPGVVSVSVRHDPGHFPTGTLSCTMKYEMKEIDSSTGEPDEFGEEDEYQLEDIVISLSDYVTGRFCVNWNEEWEKHGEETQAIETFSFSSMRTLPDAVEQLLKLLALNPCDGSENVEANRQKHILYMAGVFVTGVPLVARVRMRLAPSGGTQMELAVRSPDPEVSQILVSSL
mmetsp:Transcript_16169/g.48563  ORF Transcript_16169/g.48563 Transcript_16169/m.48563 type:complete len:878 (+) Transcript_16169:99-2732(+)